MIARLWRGWTTPEDADAYERLLREEIFPGFADRDINGYRGYEILRRAGDGETEFLTVMRFDSIDAVREFQGEDYEAAHIPDPAREFLERFEDRATHYEVRDDLVDRG